MRYMVDAGVEPWASAFRQMSRDGKASKNYQVRGDRSMRTVSRDGRINNGAFESDAGAVYLNALMWAITGDEGHARKCVEIFNAWSNLTEMNGAGTGALNGGLYAWKLVEAAEIIQSTYSGWSSSDIRAFKDMLVYPGYSSSRIPSSVNNENGTFYWRIVNGDNGRHGNQDMIAWRAMITMGVFMDNRKMYDRALRYFKGQSGRSDDIPYPSGPGVSLSKRSETEYAITYNAERRNTIRDYGYNGVLKHYVWENGQTQESSRDQPHAMFGLGIAAGISEVAWNQGDTVWNSLNNRLLKGFEFTSRYNTSYLQSYSDQRTPWEPDNFIQRLDRTGRWYSKKINPYFESNRNLGRGKSQERPIYEQALAHFDVRMGLSSQAKWTRRGRDMYLDKWGYETNSKTLDHPGWGSLTFRRPDRPGGGNNRVYRDYSNGNSGGQYRSTDVDITRAEGSYAVTGMADGEWMNYTINVPRSGTYDVTLRYRASSAGGELRSEFDGRNTGDVQMPDTDNRWENFVLASNIQLSAGVKSFRLIVRGSSNVLEVSRITID